MNPKKIDRAVKDICMFVDAEGKKFIKVNPRANDEATKLYYDATELFANRSKFACMKVLSIMISSLLLNLRRESGLQGRDQTSVSKRKQEGRSICGEREGIIKSLKETVSIKRRILRLAQKIFGKGK
jgi:hypothetical protein